MLAFAQTCGFVRPVSAGHRFRTEPNRTGAAFVAPEGFEPPPRPVSFVSSHRIASRIRFLCALNLTAATLRFNDFAIRETDCLPAIFRRSFTSFELHNTLFFLLRATI